VPTKNDGVNEFWRETDVWLFSPLARTTKLIGVLAGLLVTAVGIYLLGKTMPELPAAIIGCSTAFTLGMVGLCCEMYYKGGRTAASIKSELDAKNAWKRAIKDDVIPIFNELAARQLIQTERDLKLWCGEVDMCVRKCLREPDVNELIEIMQRYINHKQQCSREIEKVQAINLPCSAFLSQWAANLQAHQINPEFMVPA
jgi:hypothetical protein